jgi:hypothetical protein
MHWMVLHRPVELAALIEQVDYFRGNRQDDNNNYILGKRKKSLQSTTLPPKRTALSGFT